MAHDYAKHRLEHGAVYPYDATDAWWQSSGISEARKLLPATDWAHHAARGILADMNDRRGIKQGFRDMHEDVRREIVSTVAELVRQAHAAGGETWAKDAAKDVMQNLMNRDGIEEEFDGIDDGVLDEIAETVAMIILAARTFEYTPKPVPPPSLEDALALARDRLRMLLPATLEGSDHPSATEYVISRVEAALAAK